uniref:Dynein light chain n=1 Tax=Sarcophilus harrisii TaxID=9305 RepID=A0A7N4NJW8_SARHA
MGEETKKDDADYKRLQIFPLVRHSDMPEEMRLETMELCVTACEKYSNNNEVPVPEGPQREAGPLSSQVGGGDNGGKERGSFSGSFWSQALLKQVPVTSGIPGQCRAQRGPPRGSQPLFRVTRKLGRVWGLGPQARGWEL